MSDLVERLRSGLLIGDQYDDAPALYAVDEGDAEAKMTEAADEIERLRAKLAEAEAERERLGRELNIARYGQPDFSWELHKAALAEAVDRAEAAEAALATALENALREAADVAAGEVAAHGERHLSPFMRRCILALIERK